MSSNYAKMREVVERLQRDREALQRDSDASTFSLITRQLGGDAIAESMAREILNEAEEESYGDD